jgi:hypothetical protein
MERGSARLFQHATPPAGERGWNIVELETCKQVRQNIHDLLRLASDTTVPTSQVRQRLLQSLATFGPLFTTQLVRSLHRDDYAERQAVVWLLTVLNQQETVPLLQRMASDSRLSRTLRLSASLALAGMGVTAEMLKSNRRTHLYILT